MDNTFIFQHIILFYFLNPTLKNSLAYIFIRLVMVHFLKIENKSLNVLCFVCFFTEFAPIIWKIHSLAGSSLKICLQFPSQNSKLKETRYILPPRLAAMVSSLTAEFKICIMNTKAGWLRSGRILPVCLSKISQEELAKEAQTSGEHFRLNYCVQILMGLSS